MPEMENQMHIDFVKDSEFTSCPEFQNACQDQMVKETLLPTLWALNQGQKICGKEPEKQPEAMTLRTTSSR